MTMTISRPPEPVDILPDHDMHIVIAEDNAITRRMIELAISDLGWTFNSATDGVAALSAVERCSKDIFLLLSDIEMPQMTGLELARELKERPLLCHIPVVLMSSPDREPEARRAGCDGFLAKPFTTAVLVNALTF